MKNIIHDPGYSLEKITELWAFVSTDDRGEGLIARNFPTPGGEMLCPFVCADKERMKSLKPYAKQIAQETGRKVKLIRLSVREEIEEYTDAN